MTRPIDLELDLDRWFADGPDGVADRVIDAALADIESTSQRSAGFRRPWRTLLMSRTAFSAAAVVAVVVVGALAVRLVLQAPPSTVGLPAASLAPTAAPSASAAACAIKIIPGQQFGVRDCRYSTAVMHPVISFGGVAGWNAWGETARGILFQSFLRGGQPTSEGLAIFAVDRLAAKPCDKSPRADSTPIATVPFHPSSPGNGPAEFFAWLAKTPLKIGTPTATSIGGHPGLEVTVTPADGSLAACGGAIAITWTSDAPGELGNEGAGEGPTRLTAIDVDGTTVVFQVYAPKDRFAAVDAAARELLATLRTE